jgi:predicted NAD/FAD-binding protein
VKKKLAIVGSGISGMAAAWFLHRRFDITLFEQNDYVGGHTNTVTIEEGNRKVPVDTGFMVFNHVTYPLLTRLFKELEVETEATDMSFSVQHRPSNLEFNGGNLDLLFVQRRNLLSPRYWRMLFSIDRFNKEAIPAINDPRWADFTLAQYIQSRGYGSDMLDRYLIPMSSAVWSTPPEEMLDFPAMTLLRFWHNHGFLGLDKRHQWFTVTGGSRNYAQKLTAPYQEQIRRSRKVIGVKRSPKSVELSFAEGTSETFDKVLLASHADQSLAMLSDPTEQESRLLREFRYQPNTATVHTDESFMPRLRRCWASWNYRLEGSEKGVERATIHYWMNNLQHIQGEKNYFVSLNCENQIAPEHILRRIKYEHPLFSLSAIKAQRELDSLNNLSPDQTTYYAGAWFNYGFHEDGLASALACSRALAGEEVWA